jgi:hypothetical protein
LIFFPKIRFEKIDVLSGFANLPKIADAKINTGGGSPQAEQQNAVQNVVQTETPSEIKPIPNEQSGTATGKESVSRFIGGKRGSGGGNGDGDGGGMDEAVLDGLRWLVRVQNANGSWSLAGAFTQAAPKRREDVNAATALALLAFQGCGITPDTRQPVFAEFAASVKRGWAYLLQQQNPDGCFFPVESPNPTHRFYTHGFCTAAICELLALSGDETLRQPAQLAVDYCVRHQSIESGGWRYQPDRFSTQSDISVTGWIIIAMKSAKDADLNVPPDVFDKAMLFLDKMQRDNRYQYRAEEPEVRVSMTAEALFCRRLLGWKADDPRLTGSIPSLTDSPPSFEEHYRRDVYSWFFATNALFQCGGETWNGWNKTMRDGLLKYQEKSGAEKGSWNPRQPVRDAWGVQYGRLYTTCLSLYILEVNYRYNILN